MSGAFVSTSPEIPMLFHSRKSTCIYGALEHLFPLLSFLFLLFSLTAISVAQRSLAQITLRQVPGKVPVQRLGEVRHGSGADTW